ncbi:Permease of the drug/metabolite transporter (DMT) superfamily [Devosia sp. YR412]|uniref:DMT family transporter n=1 Tax=Devosia sp. YR412 TaxID=1881030 RepID=UPI0008C58E68|nr:DMT family transporter [Devosia sp. YR412]SEQ60942.1 Permease of the drug/metabolite transporter (DMT) superfamily [Devosia sp. YR412]
MNSPLSRLQDRRVVVAIALLCCLLWGSAVPAVKYGYELFALAPSDTPSIMVFAGVRFVLAGAMLLLFGLIRAQRVVQPPAQMSRLLLLGLVSTGAQYLFFYVGLAHSTGVKVSIISATSTFFSVLLAHFLLANDRLSWQRVIGCLLGFSSVLIVNLASPIDNSISFLGEGFVLAAALLFSIGTLYGRGISQQVDTGLMTGWQLLLGGLALLSVGLLAGGHFSVPSVGAAVLLAYLAAISALAFSLWGLLLKHNPVGVVAIFNCAIPIFGISLSGVILGENIVQWNNLAALALVTSGIWLVTARKYSVPPVS